MEFHTDGGFTLTGFHDVSFTAGLTKKCLLSNE